MHLRLHFRRCQEHLQGLWFIPQQTDSCSAGRLRQWTQLVTGGIGLPPESALTFTALTQVPTGGNSGEAVVLPGFTTSEQQEKKKRLYGAARWPSGAGSAPEPLPARNVPAHLTVPGRGWIFFAEKSSVSRNQFSSRHSLCSTRN